MRRDVNSSESRQGNDHHPSDSNKCSKHARGGDDEPNASAAEDGAADAAHDAGEPTDANGSATPTTTVYDVAAPTAEPASVAKQTGGWTVRDKFWIVCRSCGPDHRAARLGARRGPPVFVSP